LEALREAFVGVRKVLEIGSGTGQHAVHFAAHLPHLIWQPSDVAENLPGIELWRAEAARSNLLPALALDVNQPQWPDTGADAVFSANTLHIVSWSEVRLFFAAGQANSGRWAARPFNHGGRYTGE
jgi:ubiquinone/menaquinone biosynthesis C-methylase UbiE